MDSNLPSGTVTFLFTDIEDSTKLWEQYPEEMKAALANHDSILGNAIASNIAFEHQLAEREARILGAAEALREKINIQMSQFDRTEYDRQVGDLRKGMDEKAFSSLWSQVRRMTMEQAVQFALDSQKMV